MCVHKTADGKCKKFTDETHTSFCVDGPCEYEKPSNYDRIKNMTVEEMAEFMRTMLDCVSCQNKMMNSGNPLGKEKCNDDTYYQMCNGDYRKCLMTCKKWLESEVTDER